MSADLSNDDVIRVRIDTGAAVQEFLDLLAAQAAEGETRQPANPANRAVFRELAPYRLVEYEYVDGGIGAVDGAYLGFPDGSIYAVADEIPELVVDALVAEDPARMPPVYLYVLLGAPQPAERLDRFMKALSTHLGKALVAIFRDAEGSLSAHGYDDGAPGADLDQMVLKSVLEANMHLSKQRVQERYAARSESADGRAWAQITYNYAKHVVEFPSTAERDDFIQWSLTLCDWIYARWCSWEDLGFFAEILRPAEVAPAPKGEIVAVRLVAPSKQDGGRPWHAFGGTSAATACKFSESKAAADEAELARSLVIARDYWAYCRDTIAAAEADAKRAAEAHAKRAL